MTQKNAAEALAAYDALYKNPRTGEAIIDGDEAQVAADLAAIVRGIVRKEAATEAEVAAALKPGFVSAGLVDLDAEDYAWDAARAAIVVLKPYLQTQDDAERPLIDPVAAAVRGITPFEPSRIIEARRGGGAMLVQLAGTDEEQIFLLESIAADIRGQQS